MLGRFALDLARQGIQSGSAGCFGSAATPPGPCTRPTPQRLPSAATSAVRRVWRVPHYVGYLAAGQALAAGSPGESGRFRVDAVLRCLMAAAQLSDLTGRLASIWIADLNHPDGRPDRGLALIDASVIETVPAPETFGLHGSPSPPERDRYYSAVAGSLTAVGIPTLDAAAVRRYVEALIDDVVDLAPAMRARISLDDTREEVTDDLQEHARERLYLHTSPLPWSWSTRQSCRGGPRTSPATIPGSAPTRCWSGCRRTSWRSSSLGCPSRARDRTRRRGWLCSPPVRTIRAVRAHGSASSRDGSRSVRAGHGGRHGSAHHRFDADGVTLRHPLLVMVDGSVLPRILDRYSGRVGLMWNVYEVTGDTCPWSSFA